MRGRERPSPVRLDRHAASPSSRRSGTPPPVAGDGAEDASTPGRSSRISGLVPAAGRREPARQHRHEVRPALGRRGHERVELGSSGRSSRPGGSAGAREHGRDARVREGGRRRAQDLGAVEVELVDAPAGRRPRAAASGAGDPLGRGEHGELGRGRRSRTRCEAVRRATAPIAQLERRARARDRPRRGGAAGARATASVSTAAGAAASRGAANAPPTRPTRETATVAVPAIDRGEGPGFAAHPVVLPARVAGRRVAPSRVPAVELVQLLEPVDQRLDPDVVAQELGRRRRLAAEQLAQRPGRRTASRARRAAGTAGSPRGSGPRGRSGRAAGSRAPRPRPAPRAARRAARSGRLTRGPRRWRARRRGRDGGGLAVRQRGRERLVGGRPAQGEDDVLDRRAASGSSSRTAVDGDARRLVEREAADAGPERRERDARAGPARGRGPSRSARPCRWRARSSAGRARGYTAWITTRAASLPAAVTIASPSCDGRLAHGRELDRVATGALDLARDAGRHPERRGGGAHDGVDLEVADVAIPELDARQSVLPPRASGRPQPNRRHGTPGPSAGTSP